MASALPSVEGVYKADKPVANAWCDRGRGVARKFDAH